jgi:predicted aspartyl protease
MRVPYDRGHDPPAPVLPARLRLGGPDDWLQLAGFIDTGADVSLIPSDIAEEHLPVSGSIRIRGITGDTLETLLYRAELRIADERYVTVLPGFGSELIVGRDILNRLVVSLDGPALELALPHQG